MTVFQLFVADPAEAELRDAFLWYFERSPLAADAFRSEVFDAIDGLATGGAESWPQDAEGIRRYLLKHFPYAIHYELEAGVVTVFAISHQRRRPGYWQSR